MAGHWLTRVATFTCEHADLQMHFMLPLKMRNHVHNQHTQDAWCRAVYDYEYVNSEGVTYGKLVFLSWCANI